MQLKEKYLDKSWISPKLELRSSKVHGIGVFTKDRLKKGEVVIIWGGKVFTQQDILEGKVKEHTGVGIDEDVYLGASQLEESTIDDYMNHNCQPNIWMENEVTLIAMRVIEKNEELTADYAMWLNNEEYVMKNSCLCGNLNCRTQITGRDWRIKDIQKRYRNHFSPFINKRIKNLK